MKFGPLIEYNMRKIFAEKSYTKCGGETIPIFCMVLKTKIFLLLYSINWPISIV